MRSGWRFGDRATEQVNVDPINKVTEQEVAMAHAAKLGSEGRRDGAGAIGNAGQLKGKANIAH